ncbi:MAG: SDR family NAD(P)-dependent oxidoreductase [Gemmatimonadota bacterium]|nr:SDR family NAD(P)-dependent oxidoreductase [Gemmatimonadota bacterium]
MAELSGRIAVVTGANSGVGKSAARLLGEAGAEVVMVCRSRVRGERARVELQQSAAADVVLEIADLSSQADVRALGERLATRLERLDILVNNAGVWRQRLEGSPEGFELTFATNHLGHFLLTHLLLDRLAAGRGRIVNVSSEAHRRGDLRRADLETVARGGDWRGGIQAYGDSKLANVLFTFESVRRWGGRGIAADALHPGVLATRIWNQNSGPISLLMRLFKPFLSSSDVGGKAVMHLVADPASDGASGRYFKVEEEVEPAPPARDEELARELWERSERWTGLDAGAPRA